MNVDLNLSIRVIIKCDSQQPETPDVNSWPQACT